MDVTNCQTPLPCRCLQDICTRFVALVPLLFLFPFAFFLSSCPLLLSFVLSSLLSPFLPFFLLFLSSFLSFILPFCLYFSYSRGDAQLSTKRTQVSREPLQVSFGLFSQREQNIKERHPHRQNNRKMNVQASASYAQVSGDLAQVSVSTSYLIKPAK